VCSCTHVGFQLLIHKQAFNTFVPGLIQAVHTKTARSHVALCRNFSGPVSTTDPVKSSKDSAFFWWGMRIFCEWRHKWRTFRPPWSTSPGSGPKLLDGSISLKFLLETRLRSESFDTLDDLLGFQVLKLWSKVIKILKLWSKVIKIFD